MSGFKNFLSQDRRLCILRLLVEAGGAANESVLQTGLETLGHATVSRDDVRDYLRFLSDADLVKIEFYGEKLMIAHVRKRGVEVTEGRLIIEGVATPSMGI